MEVVVFATDGVQLLFDNGSSDYQSQALSLRIFLVGIIQDSWQLEDILLVFLLNSYTCVMNFDD